MDKQVFYSILYAITVALLVTIIVFVGLVVLLFIQNVDHFFNIAIQWSALIGIGFLGGILFDEFV